MTEPRTVQVCVEHDRPAIYCRQAPSATCAASGRSLALTPSDERQFLDALTVTPLWLGRLEFRLLLKVSRIVRQIAHSDQESR